MRVLLCGGGTSGHVMPAVAMAQIIEKNFKGAKIAFGGRNGGEENKAYTKTGHKIYTVEIQGFKRSLSINNIKSIFKVIKSSRAAVSIIKEFKPDLIIGTGGYVCYPFIRQGQRLGIKTVLHESNVSPGLVTKALGRRCDLLMLNLEGTKKYLGNLKNTIVVGNPTRSDFADISKEQARKRLGINDNEFLIVSFGGSLGSEILNKTVGNLMTRYTSENRNIRHLHSTGTSRYEAMKKSYPKLFSQTSNLKILPYIEEMPLWLTAADIAITRSGAITISELCRSATPSILIPSPNVTANHQYVNAEYMREIGASILIEESKLDAEKLYAEISALIKDKRRRENMALRAKEAYTEQTDERIVASIRAVMDNSTK